MNAIVKYSSCETQQGVNLSYTSIILGDIAVRSECRQKVAPPLLAPLSAPLISTNKNRMNTCLLETKESNVFHSNKIGTIGNYSQKNQSRNCIVQGGRSSLGILVTKQQSQNCIVQCKRGCLGIPVTKRYSKYRIV